MTFRIRTFQPGQAVQWLACGWRLWRRHPIEASAPAATFALAALLLRALPIIGDVLLLLVLPTALASYAMQVHTLAHTAGGKAAKMAARRRGRAALDHWMRQLRQALFGVWSNSHNVFPLLLLGVALVVIGLVVYSLLFAIGGQAVVSPYGFYELSPDQMARFLLAYAIAGAVWLGFAALIFWVAPLFALRDVPLVDAIRLNLQALARNAGAVLVLLSLLMALWLPAILLKPWSPFASVLALWAAVTLATLGAGFGGYCSFRLVFADAEPAAQARVASARPAPRRS